MIERQRRGIGQKVWINYFNRQLAPGPELTDKPIAASRAEPVEHAQPGY
ncbi:hypothetical protein [uncultured Bradyrhizobium sp.]